MQIIVTVQQKKKTTLGEDWESIEQYVVMGSRPRRSNRNDEYAGQHEFMDGEGAKAHSSREKCSSEKRMRFMSLCLDKQYLIH